MQAKWRRIPAILSTCALSLCFALSAPAWAQVATLVQTTDASLWSPPSPDSAGIAYMSASNTLLVSDSEVNEISALFTGDNLFEIDLSGSLLDTLTTVGFSNEPTGVAYNPANQHLFFSDDSGKNLLELNPGPDGFYNTSDDVVTAMSTSAFGSSDPEGITYNTAQGVLHIVDGVNEEVYTVHPGVNGLFDGIGPVGDDQVTSFDTTVLGLGDPEGIAYDSDFGHLYMVGRPATLVFHVETTGSLVRTIDISAANADKPAGLAYAPSSLNPNEMNLYVVDRGVDNNSDPNENDGKVYELSLPLLSANMVPSVTITAPANGSTVQEGDPITFAGTASDTEDGDLTGTLAWSSSLDGTIGAGGSFSTSTLSIGTHTVTAAVTDSGGVTGSDAITLVVTSSTGTSILDVQVASSSDDAEESASGAVSLTSSDLELVFDKSDQTVGMRFNGVTIPQGASIVDAYVQFQVDETGSEATSLIIEGEATDDAPAFMNSSENISTRSTTASFVWWDPVAWTTRGEGGLNQRTPGIASIIQEIVNRPGWLSGNSLVIIVTGTGKRTAESFNGDPNGAPSLHVEYATGPLLNQAPTATIDAPAEGATFISGELIDFSGSAADLEDGDLTSYLVWNSSLDGEIGVGGSFSTSTLSIGTHTITAAVTDSGGLGGSDAITVTVNAPGNTAPTVTISAPADNAVFTDGDPITFTATAGDAEDGNVTGSLAWSSNLDGPIGAGGTFSTSTLSIGTHTITAAVTDSVGVTGSDAITLVVTSSTGTSILDVQVAASSDDAEERASGSVSLTSSDLELVFDKSDQTVGMRFNGVTIPQGASIVDATVQFQVDETAPTELTNLTIQGEDVDDAATFTSATGNISSRARTSATASWSPVPWTTNAEAGPEQQTPNLALVLQEIINRPGWASGNSLVIIITGTGERVAESYDGVAAAAPLLHVEYNTGPPNDPPIVTIGNPGDGQVFPEGDVISFSGTASDAQDGDLTASLTWVSDRDGAIGSGGSFLTGSLSGGLHTITATASDSSGLSGFHQVGITVDPLGNDPPAVTVTSPTDGLTFAFGDTVTFTGTASDIEDGDLTTNLSWTSDLDGVLGNGASFSRSDLSEGVHTITASVTDSGGLTADQNVNISVFSGANVLVGAGDIASCGNENDQATATLLDNIAGTVFTTGDNAYPDGSDQDFALCYDSTWGRHKARTRPSPGNHDYHVPDATGYFNYFGSAAGEMGKGYYSYDVGDWHIIVLNSECSDVGGCGFGSPQAQWLQADLAANPSECTLAYWHKTRFSSGSHGNSTSTADFWQILYDAGADVVLSGHDHDYERFAPQDPNGVADPQRGIRLFVVGTGGKSLGSFGIVQPNSEVRNNSAFGVLKLTLHPTSYDWEFIPIAGQTFTDSGSAACVSLSSLNNPPLAVDDTASTTKDTPVRIDVGANDSDPDGNLQPASANTTCANGSTGCVEPFNGTLVNNGDGTFDFTPNLNFTGADSFVYEICDADVSPLCDTAAVNITVSPSAPMGIEVRVAASSDDAEERVSGAVSLTSSDLELVFDRRGNQMVGMRFNGLSIPPGAAIANATVQFQVDETTPTGPTTLTIQGEDVGDAATFTSATGNISSRPRTTAAVSWSPVPWTTKGEAGPAQQTPNLSSVVQEIVNRSDWASGNSLVLIITGTGERVAESYDGVAAAAPLLRVEYNPPTP